MPTSARPRVSDRTAALAVIALLATVYLLTFSGQFRSIDEYALYARTESLALGRGLTTPQLAFSERHNSVGALEPGQPLLAAPLYLLGKSIPGASSVASVMLFSALVTALTGGMLYLVVRRTGYGQGIAALTALAWGFGTTAWPYARSFFREPLLGLVWCLTVLLCIVWQQTGQRRYALACLLAVSAGLLVKISSITAAPVFILALLWDPSAGRLRLSRRSAVLLAAGTALAVVAAAALWRLRYGGNLPVARYTWAYPWGDALMVAYGLLLSPLKGFLFYSPILLATLPGWRSLARRSGTLVFLSLGLTAMLLYTYGSTIQWHGGVVWGPRFVVPLLPLLILPYAAALADQRRPVRVWVLLWTAAGLVVQAAAGTASWSDAVWQLMPAYAGNALVGLNGVPWWSWRLVTRSPALVQVAGWAPRQLDMLWLRALSDGTLALDRLLAGVLWLVTGLAAGILALLIARPPERKPARRAMVLSSLAAVLIGSGVLLARSGRDQNDYPGLTRAEARQLAAAVSAPRGSENALLYVSNDFFTYSWLGLLQGRVLPAWYSPHDTDALSAAAAEAAASDADRIWLVIDRVHAQADVDPEAARHATAREAYELEGLWVGGYELLAYAPQQPLQQVDASASWRGGLTLDRLALSSSKVTAGQPLLLDLWLTTDRTLVSDLILCVHLVPESGPVLASRDGAPGYGGRPTSRWTPGDVLHERRAVPIPADAAPGKYTLTAVWLDAEGGRLPVASMTTAGQTENEAALATVEVVAAP
ncbi:MAG: glycosyltransferase family 39 protein [Anaerolineae bacterium]